MSGLVSRLLHEACLALARRMLGSPKSQVPTLTQQTGSGRAQTLMSGGGWTTGEPVGCA
jgi:hypothetical protein